MTEAADRLRLAIADLLDANERMRVNLEANALILKQAMVLLSDGIDVSEALFLVPTSGQRDAAEHAIRALLDERDELRRVIVQTGLETGIPLLLLAERLELTPEQVEAINEGSLLKDP